MAIVKPEDIAPEIDRRAAEVAEKISDYVRAQKKNFDGKRIVVGIPGKIDSELKRYIQKIFQGNGWSEMDFKYYNDPDPGDPRSSAYTDVTLYAKSVS